MTGKLKPYLPFLIAGVFSLPGTLARFFGVHMDPPTAALVSGGSILGASFLLLWACDAAQADISQSLALAVVALVAVLPEYAVDMYFTWQAGKNPAGGYAHYAIANMTGANRLLIGVAWGAIVVLFWIKHRTGVRIGRDRRLELLFLAMATIYAFVVSFKGSLTWYDGAVFLGLYVAYVIIAGRRPVQEVEAEGPAETLIHLPKYTRRMTTIGLFLFSAVCILANAEPFCEGLIGTGRQFGINEFFLVQWLAPIASEAPEFVVALIFAWRGHAGLALGSLLSSKLNQWTLLVGMIPGVYGLSAGTFAHPMPLDHVQMQEILLTAAQSLLAVIMLASLQLSLSGAILLFVFFAGQLILPSILTVLPDWALGLKASQIHPLFSLMYIVAAMAVLLHQPRDVFKLYKGVLPLRPRDHAVTAMPLTGFEKRLPLGEDCKKCPFLKTAMDSLSSDKSREE